MTGTQVNIGAALRESEVDVWVEDNGPGLPKGREEAIFQKFEHDARRGCGSGHLPCHRRSSQRPFRSASRAGSGAPLIFSWPLGIPPTLGEESMVPDRNSLS
ncbi:MAG TPA: hypothetical protein DHV85_07085 [Candidatus Accumulibacter sp.]|nr:hypothetical protein [Accumulibacter sp.]